MSQNWDAVGAAVQHRRESIGITAGQLAVIADVSPTTVSKIETGGGATPKVLARVSAALQLPADALLRLSRGEDLAEVPEPIRHRSPDQRLSDLELRIAEMQGVIEDLKDLVSQLERALRHD